MARNSMNSAYAGSTVLLVDDDPGILEGVSDLLTLYGYRVIAAPSAEDALAAMEKQIPDLVISDIMMPGMDGFAFYDAVRANPSWVPIPFIFLTARGQDNDVRRGRSIGADAYVIKPFEPEDLSTAIEGRLARAEAIRQATRADLDRMKQRLIDVFGHELRTPLTYIYGNIHLLRDQYDDLPPNLIDELLDGIQNGADRLVRLTEDLILMFRIDSGVVEREIGTQVANLELSTVVDSVIQEHRRAAQMRHVQLASGVAKHLVDYEVSLYLREALKRLVDNAIKFCKPGGGDVHVQAESGPGGAVTIAVEDNGIGIEPEHRKSIFERLSQPNRDLLEQQGIGLGLALAHALVRLHGGHIDVESTPGRGSTFTIVLLVNT
jgi:signal transduction histidine kinase